MIKTGEIKDERDSESKRISKRRKGKNPNPMMKKSMVSYIMFPNLNYHNLFFPSKGLYKT